MADKSETKEGKGSDEGAAKASTPQDTQSGVSYISIFVPAKRSSRGDWLWNGLCMCGVDVYVCVVNIVNPAVDWPPLLHTLTDHD